MLNYLPAAPSPETLEGTWRGETIIFGHAIHLVFHVAAAEDGLAATFDCIEPGFAGIPVRETVCEGTAVRFDIDAVGAVFMGEHDPESGTIAGSLVQGLFATPIILVCDAAGPERFAENRLEMAIRPE